MKKLFFLSVFSVCIINFIAAQNVGIGTSTPTYPFTVRTWSNGIVQESGDASIAIGFSIGSGAGYLQTFTNSDLVFTTNNQLGQLVLKTNGNVGIGSNSASNKLTLSADASGIGFSQESIDGSVRVGFYTAPGGAYVQTHSNDDLNFATGNGVSRMVLKTNGNFGIRNSTPNASLSVGRGTGVDGTAAFFGTTHTSHFNYDLAENTYIRSGKDNGFVIINDIPGSKVGVGTSAPLASLHVKESFPGSNSADGILLECNSNVKWITKVDPGGDYQFLLYNSGINGYYTMSYINSSNGAYTIFSDASLKKDISFLNAEMGIKNILRLRPVRYHYIFNADNTAFSYGFIAQEVEKIFPDLIDTKQGKKAIAYEGFIPILTKGIQEQQQQIEDLKQQVDELKKQVQLLLHK